MLTVDYGHVPYLALILAASFGTYGLIKKRLGVPAVDGLLLESGVLALPALAYPGAAAGPRASRRSATCRPATPRWWSLSGR